MAPADEKRLCEGFTRKGKPCRAAAMPGRLFCTHHDPDLTDDERHRAISPRRSAMSEVLRTEEGERRMWRISGRQEILWTAEVAGLTVKVIESDHGKSRRKRRVVLGGFLGAPELTAKRARELSDALAEAAERARTAKTYGELAAGQEPS